MDRRTCNDAITKIDGEISRTQTKKQPGDPKTKIQEFKKDLEFLEKLKKIWKGKRVQCTY